MPPTNTDTQLAVVIAELNNKIQILIEKQEEVADNIAKIKDAIYNPEQGIFSRLREVEFHAIKDGGLRLAQLETTMGAIKKIQWLVIGTAVTTLTALIIKNFVLI